MHFFSSGRTWSVRGFTQLKYSAGFTLVELLISIAIIAIITAIVLVKYTAFDSTVLLKSTAYEVALTLREAQVRSVSAMRDKTGSGSFKYPFGVTFTPDTNSYTVFQYTSAVPSVDPYYDISEPNPDFAVDIDTTVIGRSMEVSDVCITTNTGTKCKADGIERLDISFRRPEFRALFYAMENGTPVLASAISSATVKVKSPKGSNVFLVNVSGFGQITVQKE